MSSDSRDLLGVLKKELRFLEEGGYRNSPSAQRRPQFVFQDSPTCLNFDRSKTLRSCHECTMASLVPSDCLGERFPCRHIPLNDAGFTIDTYTRLGTFEEAETAVRAWLRKKIHELETPSSHPKSLRSD
jgi:hypothetical protein